jgi:hypothetical protein
MKNINNIFIHIALFTVFFWWLAILTKCIVLLITDLIFAPLFNMRVKSVSLFGLTLHIVDEKWTFSLMKPSPSIQHKVVWDLRKPNNQYNDKDSFRLRLMELFLFIIATAAVCFIFRGMIFKAHRNIYELFALYYACGLVFQLFWRIYVLVCTQKLLKGMGEYINSLLSRIRSGETFSQLELKPINELSFKNITFVHKQLYYPIYMGYLADTGNTRDMCAPSHEMMEHYRDKEANLYQMLSYYWLIYYYSVVEPNKVNADLLMEKIGDSIYDDKCANGKRVLACYTFAHEHDLERAEELVTEGFAALESGNLSNAEKILERSLLTQLNTQIINSKFNTNFRS